MLILGLRHTRKSWFIELVIWGFKSQQPDANILLNVQPRYGWLNFFQVVARPFHKHPSCTVCLHTQISLDLHAYT